MSKLRIFGFHIERGYFFGLLGCLLACSSPLKATGQTMVLPGKFDVLPSGAASFSIPISVPPGTAGMIPSLSLNYTSGQSSGLLGVGWDVGGLLSISRCPQTFAQDGHRGGVTYDVAVSTGQADTDRFCLGGQELVAVSGIYGADGTQYRTEIEGFSEVISHGKLGNSPSWFEVHTKSGQTMEFGNTSDSHAMLSGITSAKSWLIDKISDARSNYISVSYAVNPGGVASNSEVIPAQILYTGNTAAGLVAYNKVTFLYATRPDIVPMYTGGALAELTQRLTDIETWSGVPSSPGTTEVNDYHITYQTSVTGRSLVSGITLCDGSGVSGTCLPGRSFSYQAAASGSFTSSSQSGGPNLGAPPSAGWSMIEGDFNGDGKADFGFISAGNIKTYTSNGNGAFTSHTQTIGGNFGTPPSTVGNIAEGDFNGDGKTDFAFYGNNFISTYISNGDGTFTSKGQTVQLNFGTPPGSVGTSINGDFNGDGLSDFGFVFGSSIVTFFSNGNGTFTQHGQTVSGGFGSPPTSISALIEGDFNGDGKTDFGFVFNNSINVFLSNGDGTFKNCGQTIAQYFGSPPSGGYATIGGDFNGDGLSDFAMVNNNTIFSYLSNGDGTFTPHVQTLSFHFGVPPTTNWTMISGDFNGDGKSDFGFVTNATVDLLLSKGDGTFNQATQTLAGSYGSPPSANWAAFGGDFNGDGLSDFGFAEGSNISAVLSNGLYPDLMTSFTNGLGASTTISYGTLAAGFGTYYSGWNTSTCSLYPAVYPTVDIAAPLPVVTSSSSSTGITAAGSYSSSYKYGCARIDTSGRGFLGFAQQIVTDAQTGVVQTTDFDQGYPFTGLVSYQSKVLGTVTLNSTINYYAALSGTTSPALPWSGTQFPYLASSVTASADLDGSSLPTATTTYTYDCYAYGTSCSASYGDVHVVKTSKMIGSTQGTVQTTTSLYQAPNTTSPNWILGRLLQSTVTSTTP